MGSSAHDGIKVPFQLPPGMYVKNTFIACWKQARYNCIMHGYAGTYRCRATDNLGSLVLYT